jgi:hypothetical protein
MRRSLYYLLWLAAGSCATAQDAARTDSLNIVATVNDVLYRGVENRLHLTGGVTEANNFLRSYDCEIKKDASGWLAKPSRSVNDAAIEYCKLSGRDTVVLATTSFRVVSLPTPYPYVAGRTYFDETITTQYAHAAGGLAVYFKDFYIDQQPRLKSGTLRIISESGSVEFALIGEAFNADVKSALGQVKAGDVLRFEQLVASFGTLELNLPSLVLSCTP